MIVLHKRPATKCRRSVNSIRLILQRPSRPKQMPTGFRFFLVFVVILVAPVARTLFSSLAWKGGKGGSGIGVMAEPCTEASNTSLNDGVATLAFQEITISNDTMFDTSTIFACDGGAFNVSWSGIVHVSSTIKIGNGTTVRIFGNDTTSSVNTTASIHASSSLDNTNGSSSSSSSSSSNSIGVNLDVELERLSSALNLPQGLTSAVIGVNEGVPFGPLFFVNGGELHLEGVTVWGGNSTNSTANTIVQGGGIYAFSSKVSVVGCRFENNFAEYLGGGIQANLSTLTVKDSVFRGNKAGFQSFAGDDDVDGAGGGIACANTKLFIDGCLFDDNYASKKGGGVHMARGPVSVIDSIFLNNLAGSDNVESEDALGEGAAFSFTVCTQSFDGLSSCGVNDTTFIYNAAALKGGAITVGSGNGPSYIEFHRCLIHNSTTGWPIEDDPQGEGGAFALSSGTTLVLEDSVVTNNYCGKKGAAITLSSGKSWGDPGATVIMRNSTFANNFAELESAGAIYLGSFTAARFEGDGNNFTRNICGTSGGVLAATGDTNVTVEGGWFEGNKAGENGGVFWTKGAVNTTGGYFFGNSASESGGVVFASKESSISLYNGSFEGNEALNAGVVFIDEDSALAVRGGRYLGNNARNGGGAFWKGDGGNMEITGGTFTENEADFGGFLYVEGDGTSSCTGASVERHSGVDGGAIYAVDGALLEWACDLVENKALVGPAIYAREGANVTVRGVTLSDNVIARGSVVFVVSSTLQTFQVVFSDTTRSLDLSAVQSDEESTYVAEQTAFVGFEGEAVVYSEGPLHLDDCDFSGSSASVLVNSGSNSTTVVRNSILGDKNFASAIQEASEASVFPVNASLINVAVICSESGSPCSPGSTCLEGELGVYCQCYERHLTSEEICLDGNPQGLSLSNKTSLPAAFYPSLLEGELLVILKDDDPRTTSTSTSLPTITTSRLSSGGVLWSISARFHELISWTVFPSVGILYPGHNITVKVGSLPDSQFDGIATVTFVAEGTGDPEESSNSSLSSLNQAEATDDVGTSVTLSPRDGSVLVARQDMNVTFFHCQEGSFWALNGSSEDHAANCELCTNIAEGDIEGLDCSDPGASTRNLPIKSGYWRASLNSTLVRECFYKDACVGGKIVESVQNFCGAGYEGPYCAVCSSGYGRGSGASCHACTAEFKGAMYFFFAVAVLITLVVIILLGIYLVGGKVAVSRMVSTTKKSVVKLHRRGSDLVLDSGLWGRQDIGVCEFFPSDNSTGRETCPTGATQMVGTRSRGRRGLAGSRQSAPKEDEQVRVEDNQRNKVSCLGVPSNLPSGPLSASLSAPASAPSKVKKAEGVSGDDNGVGSSQIPYYIQVGKRRSRGCGAVASNAQSTGNDGGGVIENARYKDGGGAGRGSTNTERRAEETEKKKRTVAAMIGGLLGRLPLSKLKIVIVVWQISSAFSDITEVPFPKAYDEFLSFIKIFLFDLSWILSAACITVGLDFYDKLLLATIGPVLLLGLLGITFYLGATPIISTFRDRSESLEISSSGATTTFDVNSTDRTLRSEWTMSRGSGKRRVAPKSSTTGANVPLVNCFGRAAVGGYDRGHDRRHGSNGTNLPAESGRVGTALKETAMRDGDGISSNLATESDANFLPAAFAESKREPSNEKLDVKEPASLLPGPGERLSKQWSVWQIWKDGPGDNADSGRNHLWRLFARHTTMTLIILYLVYSQVSTVVFQTFICDDLNDIDKRYLRADYTIECDTPKHSAYKIYAAIMICVYPLGIPAAFWYFLAKKRSRINPPVDTDLEDQRGVEYVMRKKAAKRKDDPTVAPTSFLWAAYHPNRYNFEVYECLRRLLLTGFLVFLPPNTPGQVAYSCLFAFISLLGFELLRPHSDRLDRMLYRTGCLVIFFTNFLALMIKADVTESDSNDATVYSMVLVIVNILFVLSIWGNTLVTVMATFSKRHVQVQAKVNMDQKMVPYLAQIRMAEMDIMGMTFGVDVIDEGDIDIMVTEMQQSGVRGRARAINSEEVKRGDKEALPGWNQDLSVMETSTDTKNSRSFDRRQGNDLTAEGVSIPPSSSQGVRVKDGSVRASQPRRRHYPFRRNINSTGSRTDTPQNPSAAATSEVGDIIEPGPRSRGFPYASAGSITTLLVLDSVQYSDLHTSPARHLQR